VLKRVFLVLALVCATTPLSADIGPPTDIAVEAKGAARIVIGQVTDVQSRFESNRFGDQLIVSTLFVDVSETLKGAQAAVLQVLIEGGTVGDLTLRVSDLPAMRAGDRAVFFLEPGPAGQEVPHMRGRGILKVTQTERIEGATATLSDVRQQVTAALAGAGR